MAALQGEQWGLIKRLVHLEHAAYSAVMNAFRGQGELTWEKSKLLDQLRTQLHISETRHQAEVLRVENDPELQKIYDQQFDRFEQLPAAETTTEAAPSDVAHSLPSSMNEDYVYLESDTDSASDFETKETRKRKKPGRKPGSTNKGTPSKRGRKRKEPPARPEGAPATDETQPVVKRPRGRPKGSGKGQRRKNKHAFASPTVSVIKTDGEKTIEEEIDLSAGKHTIEEIESMIETANREIETLEKQLIETIDVNEKTRIMAEVKRKREKLMKVVHYLETVDEDDEEMPNAQESSEPTQPEDGANPLHGTTKSEEEAQQPPEQI